MPRGPRGEKRPADVIGNAVHVMRIWWDWRTFWPAFWAGFGRMIAGMSAFFVIAAIYLGTSSADFESAVFGWAFALVVSALYGLSEGDRAVRAWRENSN